MHQFKDCLKLTGLSPTADVHHKHNQDEEQSTGQASAVFGNPLYSLPDRPQPGLRVPEPLFGCDRWLHPGHRSGPLPGRSGSFSPLNSFHRFRVKSQCIEFPRFQSESLSLVSLFSEPHLSREYACCFCQSGIRVPYFEKYDGPCFLRESKKERGLCFVFKLSAFSSRVTTRYTFKWVFYRQHLGLRSYRFLGKAQRTTATSGAGSPYSTAKQNKSLHLDPRTVFVYMRVPSQNRGNPAANPSPLTGLLASCFN